jgi:hypothetical protein
MVIVVNVIPAGFEPTTRSLEGCCSIQLSYETKINLAFLINRLQRYGFSPKIGTGVILAVNFRKAPLTESATSLVQNK